VRRSGSIARHNAVPRGRDDEQRLRADIIELARQYGRYGYRKVAELRACSGAFLVIFGFADRYPARIYQAPIRYFGCRVTAGVRADMRSEPKATCNGPDRV
jgi:hypothetical protein